MCVTNELRAERRQYAHTHTQTPAKTQTSINFIIIKTPRGINLSSVLQSIINSTKQKYNRVRCVGVGVGVDHIIRSFKAYFSMKKRVGYTVTILISVVKKIINLLNNSSRSRSSIQQLREDQSLHLLFLLFRTYSNSITSFFICLRNLLHSIIPEND